MAGLSLLPKTFAEFFAGIGLMRLGLERQGWTAAFANDIDPLKYTMYQGHFGGHDTDFVLGDVHALAAERVPPVLLATASFPCNDLSLAGARNGLAGQQSGAFWGFMRVLTELGPRRPLLVLLENVTGFLNSHHGADFRAALLALNQLDYQVDAFMLNAATFVPQSRNRLFVVGVQGAEGVTSYPPAVSHSLESAVRPKALATFIRNHPEIGWQVRALPLPPPIAPPLAAVLEELPDTAPEWWNSERSTYLLQQMSPRHRAWADEMIAAPQWSYGTVFRRIRHEHSMAELRTDGIAGCLRTPRGGSGRQILLKAGYGRYYARLLTPRECARLMGADDYVIGVPANQALFGFGDAVCVPVVAWIAEHYLDPVLTELAGAQLLAAAWNGVPSYA